MRRRMQGRPRFRPKTALPSGEVPAALGAHLAGLGRDQAVLVYCGQGGRDSLPVARALRWRGWTVDLLAGGWINYRRWVRAGLELLPRLVPLRVVGTALDCESRRVLQAFAAAGHQIIDLHDLARWRPGAWIPEEHQQPAQAWFESQLLQQLRQLNGQQPVWVSAVDRSMGTVVLPGALADAMDAAPTAIVEADPQVRMQCWRTDEPRLGPACPVHRCRPRPPDAGPFVGDAFAVTRVG